MFTTISIKSFTNKLNDSEIRKIIQCLDNDFTCETVKHVSEHKHLYAGTTETPGHCLTLDQ